MGSASPFDEFPDGTLGALDEGALSSLWISDPNPGGGPPAGFARIGMDPDDLVLWPAALNRTPTADGAPTELVVAWSVLSNKINALNNIAPWLTVHDALAWLLVDAGTATDLIEGETLLMVWASLTPHGWLPYAAGLTPAEYERTRPSERDLRVLAALRGHTLPPLRSPTRQS